MKKSVAFLFVLSVVVGGSVVGGAGAATAPSTLGGETLVEVQSADATPHLTGACAGNPDGSTTLTIAAAGSTFGSSPHPGTFEETVAATFPPQVGPAVPDSGPLQGSWGWSTGSITALSAHFEITSGSTTITGDKHFDASASPVEIPGFPIIAAAQNAGLCHDVAGEVPPVTDGFPSGTPALWGYFHTLDVATTSYTAVIDTGSDRFFDRGRARLVVRNTCADFINDSICDASLGGSNVDVFVEQFESVLVSPVAIPSNTDGCKSNGWRAVVDNLGRPFRNQGDCVSFVATGGKNQAKA